jgi:hypothetical protein
MRAQVGIEIKETLETKVNTHGIIIEEFNIVNFEFSEEFNAAIEAKQVAEQNLIKTETEQKQAIVVAESEAKRKVIAADAEAEAMIAKNSGNALNIETEGKQGYGNEYKFFSMLATNEPFLHSKIVEKLKYFDPAFHSITPEGFQSRLTFLHQCTRQGNTASASDSNNMNRTANNLAFGRPPICVLRIGDFYNTKIIMESLSIDYNDTTWDLNDEGIGVMPMMANITIGFKFLGGSDLSGPINRLQNSLSFNYYANTIVYDDRAEEIEYGEEGKITNFNYKK